MICDKAVGSAFQGSRRHGGLGALDCLYESLWWKVIVTMARLTRLVLMVCTVVGSTTVAPAPSQAGIIPWTYNAIFGPVGSLRRPTTVAYGNYGYAPTAMAYAPTTAYAAAAPYNSGCSSCNQSSSYYAPSYGSSSNYAPSMGYDGFYGNYQQSAYYGSQSSYGSSCCNSCSNGCSSCNNGSNCSNCSGGSGGSSGNCGTGCSNCSANSAPTSSGPTPAGHGSGYGSNSSDYGSTNVGAPTPDPNNTRDLNYRLNEIEHRLNEDEKFLKNQHKNDYNPPAYNRPSTYRERDETVPARRRNLTIDSNPANPDNFEDPIRRKNLGPAPSTNPLEEQLNKPDLSAPSPLEDKSSGQGKDGTVNFKEDEPQTLRLEDRATTQAVAPRQRMQIVTKQTKTLVAKSSKPAKTSSVNPGAADLARN